MKQLCTCLLLVALTQGSLAQLSGPLSGTLGPGEFNVVDTISVQSGDSLTLMPGTTFNFDGPYPFHIYGTLLAEGVEGDSIIFTTDTLANPDRWRGLRFSGQTSSGSALAYCLVENGRAINGGGVYCDSSSPSFMYCSFSGNWASDRGGGVFCYNYSCPIFINCIFNNNTAHNGCGLTCYWHSSPILTNCIINNNKTRRFLDAHGCGVSCDGYSSPTFTNCTISNNYAEAWGGGVYCFNNSSPNFANCTINDNRTFIYELYTAGGGVYCCGVCSLSFTHCTLSSNSTASYGGGVYCRDLCHLTLTNCTFTDNSAVSGGGISCRLFSSMLLTNCTFTGNSATLGGGVFCEDSWPILTCCTLSGNAASNYGGGVFCNDSSPIISATIIAFSNGSGIYFRNSSGSQVEYCDIFGYGADITFHDNDPSHGPPGIGDISTANINGDPCDTYYNIFLDPMFVDTAEGNYHLLWNSPCIDAGDPELPLDPDYTIADIGAFYYYQNVAAESDAVLPTEHALHPNWPNPFNPTTTIRYDVKQTGQVQLTIFNLLGQKVAMLTDSRHLAGSYTISWNANDLPSGIYLCRMETPDFMQTRKLVLVK